MRQKAAAFLALTLLLSVCRAGTSILVSNIWCKTVESRSSLRRLAFSVDGQSLYTCDHAVDNAAYVEKFGVFSSGSGRELTNSIIPIAEQGSRIDYIPDPILQFKKNMAGPVVGTQLFTASGLVSIVSKYTATLGWTQLARIPDFRIHHFDCSLDGRWLVLAGTILAEIGRADVGRIVVIDLNTGKVIVDLPVTEQPVQIAFSPDSRRVVVANFCFLDINPARIRIYSLPLLNEIAVAKDFPLYGVIHNTDFLEDDLYTDNVCTGMEMSAHGRIVSAESQLYFTDWRTDGVTNNIYVHDSTSGELIRKFPTETAVIRCISLSPDGRIIATGTGRAALADLFSVGPCGRTSGIFGEPTAVAMVRLWRIADGQLLWEARLNETEQFPGELAGKLHFGPREIRFSPDGRHFAYSLDGGFIGYSQLPLLITGFELAKGTAELSWLGGGGRYRIEKSSGLGQPWTLATVTTNLSFSTTLGDREAYFRVQDATVE